MICRHISDGWGVQKIGKLPRCVVRASETLHACRGMILLAARFHRDLSLGRTEVFLEPSGSGKEGGVTSGSGEANASFQPDGKSNTGSSPASSDLIVMRTRASSSSSSGVGMVSAFWPKQRPKSPRDVMHCKGQGENQVFTYDHNQDALIL